MRWNSRGLLCLLPLFAVSLQAHVVSISTGELRMDGPTATFDLRIPMYEVASLPHPETSLLERFRFADGHLTRSSCHEEDGFYTCHAEYEFPGLHPDSLFVECALYRVTVPNHIHLLTATQGTNTDQQVFDQRFTTAEVRFRPPSQAERIARQAASGAARAVGSAAGVLFLLGLALAARSPREAFLFGVVFLAAQVSARPLGPLLPLAFSARSLEAVLALTVAYLAVEVLLLPEGRARWAVVAILGACHGFSLAGLPPAYLIGALPVQAVLLSVLAFAALKLPPVWRRPAAGVLLIAALAWFATRVL